MLLVTQLVAVLALSLLLVLFVHHLIVRNHRDGVTLEFAADAALQLASLELETADWNAVLSGALQAPGVDGAPAGVRPIGPDVALDLAAETHVLNCGRRTACSEADRNATTMRRPWGVNNPHWRLFLYGRLASLAAWEHPADAYVLVWIADDGRERDDDPDQDDALGMESGAGILRAYALAVSPGGGRRGFEADLLRACRPLVTISGCRPGIRVQSRRDIRAPLS
ncbi:MAG: hypothetical protein IT178_07085 [Acidobacteria bacterium]|nr:hypothetical protein [Acidobacteriota bacterium]